MNDETRPQPTETIDEQDDQQGDEHNSLILPRSALPPTLYILPLNERPFFPAQTVPLILEQDPWFETIQKVGDNAHRMVGLLLSDTRDTTQASADDFYHVGCAARMHNPTGAKGQIQFVAEGIQRFRIVKWLSDSPPYLAQVEYPKEVVEDSEEELRAYAMAIIGTLKELVPQSPLYSEELRNFLSRFSPNDPSPLCDFAASLSSADRRDLQEVLETFDLHKRMEKVLALIKKELEVAKLHADIHKQVDQAMSEQQRKFFLREQLKAIQKELGIAKDDRTADADTFRERTEQLTLTDEAQKKFDEEIDKLSILETGSPDYNVTRSYLDWLTQLPWGVYSEDSIDLEKARTILDKDHYGLDDVKDRIIEFLAVGKLRGEIGGSIILLVGPPGVGKTSIGRSIAETVGRKFYRFSLGGMRDEAEIKGHRRTYIGAMPGKFVQAIKDAGTSNPVIMLDELDKIGMSFHGDPASALLEVLDPAQNSDFLDHYLDVRYDLSRVLFVCTANQLDTIPGPLLDRMEIIRLAGYIPEEKVQIARRHLWPKLLKHTGLKRKQISISEGAIKHVIDGYAREAGVRNLDKQLNRIVRKNAVQLVKGKKETIKIGIDEVEQALGKPIFSKEKPLSGIGIVTGLAWTALGGATLNIEATLVHSKNRGFKLTGQLGEVMKESAEIAYSYISSHLEQYKADEKFFDEAFVHLHVPEGATPKDGPSAGITMATALLSLARNKKVKKQFAMTGELTLTGQVLPVGGIREKVIAAKRNKVKQIILPGANQRDFEELPDYIKKGIQVHFAGHYDEVFDLVF